MSYIGYSNEISTFVKILVDEFGNDYEGDSYLTYYDTIVMFLNGDISSEDLIKFFDSSNFCIFELDHLIKNINDFIEKDILYKQKLNRFVADNINIESSNNVDISVKALSLLFDDFFDIYNENIFDYESFYIPFLGIFRCFSQQKFMEFVAEILKGNSLISYDFYFMVKFLKEFIEFKYLNKYVKEFIVYSQEYIDENDDDIEYMPILMFVTFKINKILSNMIKNNDFNFWNGDKKLILATLKLFTKYFKEHNILFIDKIDQDNKSFIDNNKIAYMILKYLTNFPINYEDCKIILISYLDLIFDYIEYEEINKITEVVKYLVSPVMGDYELDHGINSDDINEVIMTLTFCFLTGEEYIYLFISRCKNFGFNKKIAFYVLKLILLEDVENKKKFLITFVEKFGKNILEDFNYGDEALFNYILWITNDLVNKTEKFEGLSKVVNFLSKRSKFRNSQMYNLLLNIFDKFKCEKCYIYEGKSFYEYLINTEENIVYNRLDREYFYIKYRLIKDDNKKIFSEKESLMNSIENYFNCINYENRNNYYEILINADYFDIYKFELLDFIVNLNIDESKIKNECDFLIFNSPHEEGVKFGILLSLALDKNYYSKEYSNIFPKVIWGDIFFELYKKFQIDEFSPGFEHDSFNFLVNYELNKNKDFLNNALDNFEDRYLKLKGLIFGKLNVFDKKLNVFSYIYILIFSSKYETDVNTNTIKLKTIYDLLENDFSNEIIVDEYIYEIFIECFKIYTKSFISLTQFEILESIYKMLEYKFLNIKSDLSFKDIELDNSTLKDVSTKNFKCQFAEILKDINKIMKSPQADEYYDNLFVSEDLDVIIEILNNEKKIYNETLSLFQDYINGGNLTVLQAIYKKCNKNMFVAKVFIKIMAIYPEILLNTLKDINRYDLYLKILESSI